MVCSLGFVVRDMLDKLNAVCYLNSAAARCQPEPLEPARQDREDGGTGTDPRGEMPLRNDLPFIVQPTMET